MEKNIFFYFLYKKKYNFKGGLKCLFEKNKSSDLLLQSLPIPSKFFVFIKSNFYNKKLRIRINQKVLRGQPLTFSDDFNVPIHAPTSGLIEEIDFDSHLIEKNKKNIKIVISSDYLDKWIRLKPIENYKKLNPEKLIKIIHQSGIVGLGGGEFPSSKKLILSINKAHTLIVNAVESEPYITSDNCLIYNYIDEILTGCRIICWITKIKLVCIAIQEDKIKSILKIYNSIKDESLFKLCILKKKYPGGSSKVLIKSLTGKEIPHEKHSIDIGYLVFNVATIFSIKKAIINGEPLTERIVTFLGDKNFLSGNFWIRIGTPIQYFLSNKKLNADFIKSIYLGGPFMGKTINDLNYSVLKNTNCISMKLKQEKHENIFEKTCIRCGYCSSVCPVNLLPQQLYWYSIKNNHEQTKKHHVLDCIECKVCEKVCPSYIPLVKYFKKEKNILKDIKLENDRKKISLIRFKKREKRLLDLKNIININKNNSSFTNNNNLFLIKKNNEKISNTKKHIRKKMVQEAINRMNAKK
ncbi:electron transport complex subunit RsxC [Buchnera aphidicola (Acyrthosiphon lactucae)]|uniref:Ion-translocating oxidoreductase complex subunit C n=1 Tax=Buchnera aphidicola (Acyrthosiphon lactucae) TaxID=1241832 RepID=A0A4D6XY65_9GAMM|nr:electron transport complex subunit RsxC [Buchnera aphidicola]QCI17525.1 electron transport complex subunit RsxC [Buchnera aphidicola (Acyrthosiphon lactucae)]